jgi:hypothetical protein
VIFVREVIVETVGKGTRKVKVGRKKKKRTQKPIFVVGIICSPRIYPQPGSDIERPRKSRSWKTPKKGQPKPKKPWQRNGFGPDSRRKKYGKRRGYSWPSVRFLNEMGLCIYPYTSVEEQEYWENLHEDHMSWWSAWQRLRKE